MGLQNYGIFYLLNTPYIELNNKHSLSQTDDFFIYKLNACTLKHITLKIPSLKISLVNEETFDIF